MTREEAREKATELVDKMTVEEMASQLRFDALEIKRLGIEEYNWWNEALHGVARAGTATMFPQAIGLSATFDEELLHEVADVISTEARAKYNESTKHGDRDIYKGLTFWSPNVNIFRDPRWGRGHETYGEDPYLTSRLGVAFIKGLQGDGDGVDTLKTAACAKHFAVHSGPENVRHSFDAKVSDKDLWETYLPAFEACVKEAKVESVMGAYNRTNGEPCCAHEVLMKQILRNDWGFEGHYLSDCWAIQDFHENHMVTKTPERSAALALNMGCDLNCGCTYQRILNAYRKKFISKETIRESAIRLFTTRFLLGMFEHTPYDDISYEVVECKEHLDVAKKAELESIVMLKNNGILPLDITKIKTIGVIGPNADSRRALIGNYHGTSSRYITVLNGIQDYVSANLNDNIRVMYSEGSHLYLEKGDNLAKSNHLLSEAATVAEYSDIIILCLGLDETLEGEEGDAGNADASGDKKDLRLPLSQRNLLDTVIKSGKPFILCNMTGSAMDLKKADEHADAILQLWYPGARGGRSVADILFGKVSPSGKLPVTFYGDLNELPAFEDYSMDNRTYRYFGGSVLYPFGYGLTYGNAVVQKFEVNATNVKEQGATVHVTVKNESEFATGEVLQCYIHINGSRNEVRNHRLVYFKRVSFLPHEEKCIEFRISSQSFCVVNEDGKRVFEGDGFTIHAGFGQPDLRTWELLGDGKIKTFINNY